MRKMTLRASLILLAILSTAQAEILIEDSFETPHDYLTTGLTGTDWDGYFGGSGLGGDLSVPSTANAINAGITNSPNDVNVTGALYMESDYATWEQFNPENKRGPYIYKLTNDNFFASAKVAGYPGCTDGGDFLYIADGGIMARVPDINDAGPGEDFVCIRYIPVYCDIIISNVDDSTEHESQCIPVGCAAFRWLGLERVIEPNGSATFYFWAGPDGQQWYPVGYQSLSRPDMNDTLQIGLFQCGYIPGTTWIAFDDFKLDNTDCHIEADLNNDCLVNNEDIEIIADEWLTTGTKADIYPDDGVDFKDFAILANNWLIKFGE